MNRNCLTKERLHYLFVYSNGELRRRVDVAGEKAGREAGWNAGRGYRYIQVDGIQYSTHRIIYLMFHGYLPEMLDHIDRDKSNNRIENLRPCTKNQNFYNAKISKRNTSGVKGVSWNKTYKKWGAQIKVNYKPLWLGYFTSIKDAEKTVIAARKEHHKEFACNG